LAHVLGARHTCSFRALRVVGAHERSLSALEPATASSLAAALLVENPPECRTLAGATLIVSRPLSLAARRGGEFDSIAPFFFPARFPFHEYRIVGARSHGRHMARRLAMARAAIGGHTCVGRSRGRAVTEAIVNGGSVAGQRLRRRCPTTILIVWLMGPSGAVTEPTLNALVPHLWRPATGERVVDAQRKLHKDSHGGGALSQARCAVSYDWPRVGGLGLDSGYALMFGAPDLARAWSSHQKNPGACAGHRVAARRSRAAHFVK
jgi:hypothetical protein